MKDERVAAESATGRGSSVAVGPDDNLLQAVCETGFKDRVEKALVKEARRSYAVWFGIPLAKVTRKSLENSHHGLREWIKWAKSGESFDGPKDELPCGSKAECARRIGGVLSERWAWLAEKNLRTDVDMTPEMFQEFHERAREAFSREPSELERSGDAQVVRRRFNREKQRRAGTCELWELFSSKGCVTETDVWRLADLCKQRKREKRRAQDAKDALWRAKSLQRRLEQEKVHRKHLHWHDRKMLRDLEDGSLLATANHCVREQGRGRLHGDDPNDYLDIGTNQEFSAVVEVLDGPQTRPCTDRFKH